MKCIAMSDVHFSEYTGPAKKARTWNEPVGLSPIKINDRSFNRWHPDGDHATIVELFVKSGKGDPCAYDFLRFYGDDGHEIFKSLMAPPDADPDLWEDDINGAFAYLVYNYYVHFELPWKRTFKEGTAEFPTLDSPLLVRRRLGYSTGGDVAAAERVLHKLDRGAEFINTIPMSTTYCVYDTNPDEAGTYLYIGLPVGCPIVAYGGFDANDDHVIGGGECEILLPRNCRFRVSDNVIDEKADIRIIYMELVDYTALPSDPRNASFENARPLLESAVRMIESYAKPRVKCVNLMNTRNTLAPYEDDRFAEMMYGTYKRVLSTKTPLKDTSYKAFSMSIQDRDFAGDNEIEAFVRRFVDLTSLPVLPVDTQFYENPHNENRMRLFRVDGKQLRSFKAGTRYIVLPGGDYLLINL